MKKLFPKMFFVSDCAKGMLFALTLATVGNYLWGSLFHLLLLWAGEPRPVLLWTFAVGALAITLYSAVTHFLAGILSFFLLPVYIISINPGYYKIHAHAFFLPLF